MTQMGWDKSWDERDARIAHGNADEIRRVPLGRVLMGFDSSHADTVSHPDHPLQKFARVWQ